MNFVRVGVFWELLTGRVGLVIEKRSLIFAKIDNSVQTSLEHKLRIKCGAVSSEGLFHEGFS